MPPETLTVSGLILPVIAAAVGLGGVRKCSRLGIELSRVPRRDTVPAVSSVFFSNSR